MDWAPVRGAPTFKYLRLPSAAAKQNRSALFGVVQITWASSRFFYWQACVCSLVGFHGACTDRRRITSILMPRCVHCSLANSNPFHHLRPLVLFSGLADQANIALQHPLQNQIEPPERSAVCWIVGASPHCPWSHGPPRPRASTCGRAAPLAGTATSDGRPGRSRLRRRGKDPPPPVA